MQSKNPRRKRRSREEMNEFGRRMADAIEAMEAARKGQRRRLVVQDDLQVILRAPRSIRTAADRRECAVTGIRMGNELRRTREPLAVKVSWEAGRWVHEVEELNIWSAEKEFDLSREYFCDFLRHLYVECANLRAGEGTPAAMAMKRRLAEIFSEVEELV
jgi:hypothetical protein